MLSLGNPRQEKD